MQIKCLLAYQHKGSYSDRLPLADNSKEILSAKLVLSLMGSSMNQENQD